LKGSDCYEENGYVIRVYRQRHSNNFKDNVKSITFEDLRDFIIHATFIGPAPGIVRELSTENARKIFQYNLPVLILFRNTSASDARHYD
jgi:hypothetical protein